MIPGQVGHSRCFLHESGLEVMRNIAVAHLLGLIENALCYPQVGVKKAVHPIRFASDSRIALLAAESNPPGSDRLPRASGDDPPQGAVRSGGCTFSRIRSENCIATIGIVLLPAQERGRGINRRRTVRAQNEERGPLPERSDGLLFQD